MRPPRRGSGERGPSIGGSRHPGQPGEDASPIPCARAEDLLSAATPGEAARALAGRDDALGAHLAGCEACAELARGIAELGALPPGPDPEVLRRSVRLATLEVRSLAARHRRAARIAGLKAALVFVAGLPGVLLAHYAVAGLVGVYVLPSLPGPVRAYVVFELAAGSLALLSVVVFTLVLVAGAAARPPRGEIVL